MIGEAIAGSGNPNGGNAYQIAVGDEGWVYMHSGQDGRVYADNITEPTRGDFEGDGVAAWNGSIWPNKYRGSWRFESASNRLNAWSFVAEGVGISNSGVWAYGPASDPIDPTIRKRRIMMPMAGSNTIGDPYFGHWVVQSTGVTNSIPSDYSSFFVPIDAEDDEYSFSGFVYLQNAGANARWIMWYGFKRNGGIDQPNKVYVRSAIRPTGPWSEPVRFYLPGLSFITDSTRGNLQIEYSDTQAHFIISTIASPTSGESVSNQRTYKVPDPFVCTLYAEES